MDSSCTTPYSVLEDETHLVFVLFFGEDFSGVWDGSNLVLNLLVTTLKMCLRITNIFFNFLLKGEEFWVFLLNIEGSFQLVNFWELCNDLCLLFLKTLDHFWIESAWLVL